MTMVLTAELVRVYASLFVHQWEAYAVQRSDGSYWRAHESLSLGRLVDHLLGRYTVGAYLLDRASTCRVAVFDDDRPDGLSRLQALAAQLWQVGIWSLLEASRRGGHLWLFFEEPTPAAVVRAWLLPYAQAWGMELYPKQSVLADGGLGSLVRLPLGIHRQTGGWYPFLERTAEGVLLPVGETVAENCAWLAAHVQRVRVPVPGEGGLVAASSPASFCLESSSFPGSGVGTVACRPGCSGHSGHPGRSEGGPGAIRVWCQSQDIVAMIGRYVALDRRGVGSCPFKAHHYRGDQRPSFQVFGGSDPHWYCYTWGRAGDLFDFFCEYYGLTPQQVWERLQRGELG